jgi:hypothetical protein
VTIAVRAAMTIHFSSNTNTRARRGRTNKPKPTHHRPARKTRVNEAQRKAAAPADPASHARLANVPRTDDTVRYCFIEALGFRDTPSRARPRKSARWAGSALALSQFGVLTAAAAPPVWCRQCRGGRPTRPSFARPSAATNPLIMVVVRDRRPSCKQRAEVPAP